MIRRAFLSSRVIQVQGKFDSNMLVKNVENLELKTKIAQNLQVRLSWEQFSYIDQVKSYPRMYVACLFMRFSKSCTGGQVRACTRKLVEIFEKVTCASVKWNLGGPAGGSALERASPPMSECTI